MEEDIKGKFVERKSEDGIRYIMYVPENVNPNTPVFTYVYGAGGPNHDWTNAKAGVMSHGSDSIIIMPNMDWSADWAKNTMGIVNEVKNKYGITNTNVSSSGFSMGGFAGYVTVAENIKQNPDCEPQTVFFIDDYGSKTYHNYKQTLSEEETVKAFKDNQTVFFIFEPQGKNTAATSAYAKAGLNVIRVKCIGQDHVAINSKFFSNGVYDYMAGGPLPKDGYIYQKYNNETGKWEDIPYEEISNRDNLNNYFNIDTFKSNLDRLYTLPDITIKSDDKTLENYMNNIRRAIRNTSFLSSNFNQPSYSSTTKVPTAIPDVVNSYFAMTSSLLNKIANKTAKVAAIAGEIDYLDQNLSKRADAVNKNIPLYIAAEIPIENQIHQQQQEELKEIEPQKEPTENDNSKNESTTNTEKEQQTTTVVPSTKPSISTPSNEEPPVQSTPQQQPPQQTEEEFDIKEYFPEYDDLYTTDNKTVYNYNDEYKVVIHHEDGKVTGVEHYYDYGSKDKATSAVEQLQTKYKEVENFDQVIQKDQYVKVIFKEEMYKDMTLDKFKENYKELKEVVEETI